MDFSESLKYLLSLGNEVSSMKLGLVDIRKLLAALGNPQNNFLKVQVAGTNGKGSVCAFLDAICISAGVNTGLYTSPHLVSITERVKLGGEDIGEDDFARHATHVRATAESLLSNGDLEYRPTFFEQMTATALVAFAEAEVELAILETGLGGRLDATTAASAEIAAITQIDYDHQEYLGESLAEIAGEKAAIMRPDSKVVIAEQKPEAERVIRNRCELFGIDARAASQVRTTCGSGWLNFTNRQGVYDVPRLGLIGRHQIANAKVAILLAEILHDHFSITADNIIEGLQNARHPGRLEYHGKYLFDGAHNIAGAKALREYLDEFITQPITVVFGAMKGKDIAEIGRILFPRADHLILTRPENSRALTADEIIRGLPENFAQSLIIRTDTVREALSAANRVSGENQLILVTGSIYLIGEAKRILQDNLKFEI